LNFNPRHSFPLIEKQLTNAAFQAFFGGSKNAIPECGNLGKKTRHALCDSERQEPPDINGNQQQP